jgi:nucleotide-binding universal stress UspA family protein
MQFSFKTILVPVDFTINTELAIHKALSIRTDENTILHLVHVQLTGKEPSHLPLQEQTTASDNLLAKKRLEEIRSSVIAAVPSMKIFSWICYGDAVQKTLEGISERLKADLIIIGQHLIPKWWRFRRTLNPESLAINTGITVWTVKPGSMHQKIKTVVVPVTDEKIHNKVKTLAALNLPFHFRIYLVSVLQKKKKNGSVYPAALLDVFRWMKENLRCSVEFSVLHGENKPVAILNYAHKMDADLLLLHTHVRNRWKWLERNIFDRVPPSSKMQVMWIDPENQKIS